MSKAEVFIPGAYYGSNGRTDQHISKKFLIDKMMDKYNITEEDLHDISIVKAKMRNIEINNILE